MVPEENETQVYSQQNAESPRPSPKGTSPGIKELLRVTQSVEIIDIDSHGSFQNNKNRDSGDTFKAASLNLTNGDSGSKEDSRTTAALLITSHQ